MKVLVGIPVFRIKELVQRCLDSVIGTPSDVLVVDNASDEDVKDTISKYKVVTITNSVNGFCNGAWNQILEYGLIHEYDVIALGSSDVKLHDGWFSAITNRFENYPKEVCLPSIGDPVNNPDFHKAEYANGGVPGYFTFLNRESAQKIYPIPKNLKHWFGDQHIFETLRSDGWKVAVLSEVRAYHNQSAITARTPEAYTAIEQDIKEWNKTQR